MNDAPPAGPIWPAEHVGEHLGEHPGGGTLPRTSDSLLRDVAGLTDLAAIRALTGTAVAAIEAFLVRYRTSPSALYRMQGCEALLRVDNMLTLAMEQMLLEDGCSEA